ncbi:aminoglycoside N(3)-acetyltransferase [Natronosalvus vescus]|uniref:aminoglycoside N(3)-acetyltransferase n=1 Tax=Natronosalvus vescus TaxID=2953881 RepID=UPI002091C4AF|nr:AAC(3) family N-acetyltransferase [Natronosalvus vescus]
MSEKRAIEAVDEPVTVTSLVDDFQNLGIEAGDTLLVHSSLSALGWVCVDAQTVVDALMTVVTEEGTLVMPTHSTQYSDPSVWSNPPVPESWIETIRTQRPPYRPETTPTRGMGAIVEAFRTYPAVRRSAHPTLSFAAWGANAATIVDDHPLDNGLGEDSPLARVYNLDGSVLLLGVGHESNTSLHLAEYRAAIDQPATENVAPVLEDGERVVARYTDIETDTEDFPDLGVAFEAEDGADVRSGTVGAADATLLPQRPLVDFAVDWLEANR